MNNVAMQELRNLEIFKNICDDSLNKIIEMGVLIKYPSGRHIFRDKDDVKILYVVLSGTVSLDKSNECGHKRAIFILGKGKMINDVIIQELPSSINCEVFEEAEILSFNKEEFLKLMEVDFILTKNVMCSLSMKVRRLYRQIKNSTGVIKMEKRLCAKLWKLSKDYGYEKNGQVVVDKKITITYLADLLGSKRETISRALKILCNENLIEYKNKQIIVNNQEKLSEFFKAP
ncbi:Crp/Fnr family transcriptional regulator [Clostridium botulinum]|nr:Crp/Fnr family transcriptional regulator [Clostridium botulinum]